MESVRCKDGNSGVIDRSLVIAHFIAHFAPTTSKNG